MVCQSRGWRSTGRLNSHPFNLHLDPHLFLFPCLCLNLILARVQLITQTNSHTHTTHTACSGTVAASPPLSLSLPSATPAARSFCPVNQRLALIFPPHHQLDVFGTCLFYETGVNCPCRSRQTCFASQKGWRCDFLQESRSGLESQPGSCSQHSPPPQLSECRNSESNGRWISSLMMLSLA